MSQQTGSRGGTVWALVITSVAGFMAALDNLVVTTALPSIREDLGGHLEDLEWTVSAYTLTFAVLLMFGAALGDRFGRRKLFGVGLSIFTAASAAAALAPGINELIAARAIQGVGSAIMMPLTLTLLTAAVPAAKRGMAFGIWGAVNGLAVASGPLIGGALTEHVSWQWIFWLNVPLGLALLPLARMRLSESYGTGAPLDFTGTLLASGGLRHLGVDGTRQRGGQTGFRAEGGVRFEGRAESAAATTGSALASGDWDGDQRADLARLTAAGLEVRRASAAGGSRPATAASRRSSWRRRPRATRRTRPPASPACRCGR